MTLDLYISRKFSRHVNNTSKFYKETGKLTATFNRYEGEHYYQNNIHLHVHKNIKAILISF